jgi:uncharacterized protein YggE
VNRSRGLVSIVVLGLILTSAPARAQIEGIHVSGHGSVEVEPDMGHVQLHVRREGQNAAELGKELDLVVRAVLELTRDLGIARRDVTAAAISINPRHRRRNNETVVDGLVATRTIALKLRDLDRFSALMNRALAAGVNNVDPMRLDTSRREALENQALELAMNDAKAEAERVAEGFAIALGPVIDVQVGGHAPRPQAAMLMRESSDGGAFSPGIIRIDRYVQATFAIQDS